MYLPSKMIEIAWARKTNAVCAFFEKQTSANKFQSEGETHKGILYNYKREKICWIKICPWSNPTVQYEKTMTIFTAPSSKWPI